MAHLTNGYVNLVRPVGVWSQMTDDQAAIFHKDTVHFTEGSENLIFYNPQCVYCSHKTMTDLSITYVCDFEI